MATIMIVDPPSDAESALRTAIQFLNKRGLTARVRIARFSCGPC
jgi:hypothetical protein